MACVAASIAVRKAGCPDASASDAYLRAALDEGFTQAELADMATAYPGKPIKYLVNALRGRRTEAASGKTAKPQAVPHRPGGTSPTVTETAESKRAAQEAFDRSLREFGYAK